jgi:hypothetical protein
MSIEDEIDDRVDRKMLFAVTPKAAGATIRRAMFVEERLWAELNSPEGDEEWETRIGNLRADLEVFVSEEEITPKYLFLLYPADDAVWEIRSVQHEPTLRVLGLFAAPDVYVSMNYAKREDLDGWQSRAWKTVKRTARAAWRKLFHPYVPIITINVKDVCSGASDGIFYKER